MTIREFLKLPLLLIPAALSARNYTPEADIELGPHRITSRTFQGSVRAKAAPGRDPKPFTVTVDWKTKLGIKRSMRYEDVMECHRYGVMGAPDITAACVLILVGGFVVEVPRRCTVEISGREFGHDFRMP